MKTLLILAAASITLTTGVAVADDCNAIADYQGIAGILTSVDAIPTELNDGAAGPRTVRPWSLIGLESRDQDAGLGNGTEHCGTGNNQEQDPGWGLNGTNWPLPNLKNPPATEVD